MTVLLMYPFLFCIFLQIEVVFAKVATPIPNSTHTCREKVSRVGVINHLPVELSVYLWQFSGELSL